MNFENLNVLVIGDVMLDHYSYGVTDRRSPEADVAVFDLETDSYKLGGAANVALNIQALGATVKLITVLGDDVSGHQLSNLAADAELDIISLSDSSRKTTVKQRLIVDNQHILRIDDESNHDIHLDIEMQLRSSCERIFNDKKLDVIVLQDYNKGLLTHNLIRWIIEQAIDLGIKVAVDPKQKNFKSYAGASLIKPNKNEMSWASGYEINKENVAKAVAKFQSEMGVEYWFVTLSENGVFASDLNDKIHSPTAKIDIVDVCGAGDNVISILALLICINQPLAQMARICNLVGKMSCLVAGTAIIDRNALEKALM